MEMIDSSLPCMGHISQTFQHISPEGGHKRWLLREMPKIRLKFDKMLKNYLFLKFILLNDFSRTYFKILWTVYGHTRGGIRVKSTIRGMRLSGIITTGDS